MIWHRMDPGKLQTLFDITTIIAEFRRDMTLELEKIHRALDEIESNIDRLESSLVAMMRDLAKIKAATLHAPDASEKSLQNAQAESTAKKDDKP